MLMNYFRVAVDQNQLGTCSHVWLSWILDTPACKYLGTGACFPPNRNCALGTKNHAPNTMRIFFTYSSC